ncbi:MAG: dTDP-4-dehydrorhamnose 3,5-epimerase [Gammaproteobacteria bacterium]|nr:dTDP-4-dehydrorhamnose 3,5-epimerase [Gammaproteobacteria bacterium]
MKIIETTLPGVIVIEPKVFGDQRGFFMETYQADRYREAGIELDFVQDNHSRSAKGVLRGLHYQVKCGQGKLVHVTRGIVFDVAVDIRKGSPTFGQYYSHILSEDNHRQMYIPPGFAHGFCVLTDTADFVYKCTDFYNPEYERSILWNDPDIGIEWPLTDVTLSDKDKKGMPLRQVAEVDLPPYEGGV